MSTKRTDVAFVGLLMIVAGLSAFLFAPERTQDGLVHLYWNSFWSAQVRSGDWFPQWYAQGYGGLGNPAFLFYPPLSRYVALPFFWLGIAPMTALKCAAATFAVINVIGAAQLAAYFFKGKETAYRLLVTSLAINPYLFYCLFWRGAFAECLAIALMPYFVLATLKISNQCSLKNGVGFAFLVGLMALTHVPSLIVIFFLFNGYSLLVAMGNRNRPDFFWRTVCFAAGLAFAAPYLGPIFLNLSQIRQPTWYPIQDHFAFGKNLYTSRHIAIYSLMFGTYLVTYLLAIRPALKRRHQAQPYDIGLLVVLSGVALFMGQPLAEPIYKIVPLVKKVQFPSRFLAITSTLVPTLAVLSASLRFKHPKPLLAATLPVLFALCLPLYLLFQTITTTPYLSTANKAVYSTLITDRIENLAFEGSSASSESSSARQDKKVVKLFKKELILFNDRLVVPDVVDYVPKSLDSQSPFWTFDGNTVMPAAAYQDHYAEAGMAELQLTMAKSTSRRWRAQVEKATTVELGITDFANWQITSVPAGLISERRTSNRGLIAVDIASGSYEIMADYQAGWSKGFMLLPPVAIGLMLAVKP